MIKKMLIGMACIPLLLFASSESLTLDEALELLEQQNLDIKASKLEVESAKASVAQTQGMHWGKLDLIQDVARSNDAGNVFGFKLTSREAKFADFGFDQFISQMDTITPGSPTFDGGTKILATQPNKLNYPDARNFFQTKLRYEVPIFTGFAISSYTNIMERAKRIKELDAKQVLSEKRFELKKSFYDMALLNESISNIEKILDNIHKLEHTTQTMIDVGYAKKVDLLEVEAKKGNVERLLVQMKANRELLYHYISFLLNQKVHHITPPEQEVSEPKYNDTAILERNLDIKKAQNALEVKRNMINAQEASYYPTVGAFAEIATADNTFLGNANDHKAYTVGARLTWNLFNGGSDNAKIEKSRIEELKMQSQVSLAKHGIALKLAKIRTEIKSADEEIASLQKELQLADAIYKNYEGRYKEKLVSMNDVIIKQSARIEKVLQLLVAKNKRTEKIFALEKLANGDLQ